VLKEIIKELPEKDFLYLGDNARAPYGTRSFETVYEYTLECVKALFDQGCNLVVLACNTASAKALRTIQQKDLPLIAPTKRVLGVIRPTAEIVGDLSKTKHVGVLATPGTVSSNSYITEFGNFYQELKVYQEACPMWVSLIENDEIANTGSAYFIKKNVLSLLAQSDKIDTVILGCTHYPLIENEIRKYLPSHITIISQGKIIASSLKNYLSRHPEIESRCSSNGSVNFLTTDLPSSFDVRATRFFGSKISAKQITV
jgi:glutamate racemase